MTTAHPLAPRNEKKKRKRKKETTANWSSGQREMGKATYIRIDQCMNKFFPRGNGDDLHNNQFIYELIWNFSYDKLF